MKNTKLLGAAALAVFLTSVAIPAGEADGRPQTPEARTWSAKMREMEAVLRKLLLDVTNDDRFNDKRYFKEIEKNAARFAALAHDISKGTRKSPDQDLSLEMIGSDFSEEAKYASKALADGHRAYARTMLSSMTRYCVACHTRTNGGPSFADPGSESKIRGFDAYSRGNYFTAVREFDRALTEYEKILADPKSVETDPMEYERALRAGLSIAVRVKREPDLGIRLVDRVATNAKTPYFLREQAKDWKKSLVEWKAEKPGDLSDPSRLYAEANRLVEKARATQKFPTDRSADILYLRASGLLHELLGKKPSGLVGSNALYLTGLSYDVLDDYGIRDSAGFYYRACIRLSPHTEVSSACYRKYEEDVYFGYTGSGGTYIPSDVRARMNELESLSSVATEVKGSPLQ